MVCGTANLLERVREEVAHHRRQARRESFVETGASQRLVGRTGVEALKLSDRAGFAAGGETHDERPDEHRDVDSALADDDIALCAMSSTSVTENREVNRRLMRSGESSSSIYSPLRY